MPENQSVVFKGPIPTQVSLSLTRAFYVKLQTDALLNGIFSKQSVQERTTSGYVGLKVS